jgi:LysR family hydrogen peroxide-inducible transcriptional activator
MTLIQLKYALALLKHGTFKAAAEKLGITQPGLSLQIQKLEEHVGISLFDRSNTPVRVTAEGRLFLEKAGEIVLDFDQLSRFSQLHAQGYEGRLIVGIIPTLAPFLVPLFVDELRNSHPEFKLDIQEMLTEEVVSGVRDGTLDAGLISTPARLPSMRINPLFYERFFLYSAGDVLAMDIELKNIDYNKLWLLDEGNCFRDQINNFCDLKKMRLDKDFIYRSNSIESLIRIVDTMGGLTILPELTTLILSASNEEQLKVISNKAREISLIARKATNKERFLTKLTSHIQMNIPSSMLSANGLDIVDPELKL